MSRHPHFRITGGRFKGQHLYGPADRLTRPMQGALRQTLFDILRGELDDASVLDLFSGTGSLGLEALSRGAAAATFWEHHWPALEVLRKNIAKLGCADRVEVHAANLLAVRAMPEMAFQPFDIVLLDPPFSFMDPESRRDLDRLAARLLEADCISSQALLVHQLRRKQTAAPALREFLLERERERGSVKLAFYRRQPPGPPLLKDPI